jgi:hypothetical protein
VNPPFEMTLDVLETGWGAEAVISRSIRNLDLISPTKIHPCSHLVKHIALISPLSAINPFDAHPLGCDTPRTMRLR